MIGSIVVLATLSTHHHESVPTPIGADKLEEMWLPDYALISLTSGRLGQLQGLKKIGDTPLYAGKYGRTTGLT